MDADSVTERLASENTSEAFAAEMLAQFQQNDSTASVNVGGADAPAVADVAESIVTTEYVRGELRETIGSLYAYLHGERDDLVLEIDLSSVRQDFGTAYEQWVTEAEVGELEPDTGVAGSNHSMAALAANESQFRATRESFEDAQLERIQEETPRERSREELEELYADNRDRIRQEMVSRLEDQVADADAPAPLAGAMVAYGSVGIDALVAAETSYDAYMADEAAARETLASAVGVVVEDRVSEEVPETLDLTADMDEGTTQSLAQARTAVSVASLLVYVLPVGALVSAGLLGYVSRRRSNALWRVGGAVAAAGLLGFVAATVLSRVLDGAVGGEGGEPTAMARAFLGVLQDAVGTVGTQSLVVLAVGFVLVASGVAVRRGLVPLRDDTS